MADLLVCSALQSLGGAIEDTPNLMLASRKRLKRAYFDLKQTAVELQEAYALAELKMVPYSAFIEITAVAFKLNRAAEAFAYNAAAAATSVRESSLTSKLKTLMLFLINNIKAQRSKVKLVDYLVSLLHKKIKVVRSMVDSISTSAPTDLDSIEEEDLVGLEENIPRLVTLMEKPNQPRTFFIGGVRGSGKTTLARKVYEDSVVRSRFDCFAWVNDVTSVRDVWESLMVQLSLENRNYGGKLEGMRDEEMVKAVSGIMKCKRCLVVLDDIWVFEWDWLKNMVLQDHGVGTRVLITTRRSKLIEEDNVSMFHLQPLNGQQSWELFKKRIQLDEFVTNCGEDKKMIKLGDKMVAYCEGLPLAINVLSGLLFPTRFEVSEWEKICRNLKSRKGKNRDESGLSLVLNSSYEKMSVQLKQCFLHLAHFPENYEIRAKELCQIWIAEGFIKLTELAEVEAYGCLRTLVKMRMVQVGKWGSSGSVKTCRVHSLIREFCLSIAESQGFLHIVDFRTNNDPNSVVSSSSSFNRMSIHLKNTSVDTELLSLVKKSDDSLRSFMCFNQSTNPYYGLELVKSLLKNLCMLRVLKFENVTRGDIEMLPEAIKGLRLLNFLSLKNTHVRQLPSSIGKLGSLLTLDLRTNWTSELPPSMSKLLHLRHLYLPSTCTVKGNKYLSLENLTILQTLVSVSTDYFNLTDLAKMKNLVKLSLNVHDIMRFRKAFESSFDHLESLALENSTESKLDLEPLFGSNPRLHKLRVQGRIKMLPRDIHRFDSNLVKINLKLTRLEKDPMVELGNLKKLKLLSLERLSFIGSKMVCSVGSFPQLQSLSLIRLESLEEWRIEEEALKNLTNLHINYCFNLEKISPNGVRNVSTLKQVVIQRMPRHFQILLEEQGKEPYMPRPQVTNIELLD